MTKAQELLTLLEMSDTELHRSMSRKSHIHDLEVSIRDMENRISLDKNPDTKKSKMDKLAQKKATLAKLKQGH